METARSERTRTVSFTGLVKVVEMTGAWGIYAGERIVVGDGRSFHDDLGIRLRKAFETGAGDALKSGQPLSEAFELGRARITVELLD